MQREGRRRPAGWTPACSALLPAGNAAGVRGALAPLWPGEPAGDCAVAFPVHQRPLPHEGFELDAELGNVGTLTHIPIP